MDETDTTYIELGEDIDKKCTKYIMCLSMMIVCAISNI